MPTFEQIIEAIQTRITECMKGPGASLHDALIERLLEAEDEHARAKGGERPIINECMAQAAFLLGMAMFKYKALPEPLHSVTHKLADQVCDNLSAAATLLQRISDSHNVPKA